MNKKFKCSYKYGIEITLFGDGFDEIYVTDVENEIEANIKALETLREQPRYKGCWFQILHTELVIDISEDVSILTRNPNLNITPEFIGFYKAVGESLKSDGITGTFPIMLGGDYDGDCILDSKTIKRLVEANRRKMKYLKRIKFIRSQLIKKGKFERRIKGGR